MPSPLIACPACGQDIAAAANACPRCGNPNTWTHPEILRFAEEARSFTRTPRFQYAGRGNVLTGTANLKKGNAALLDAGMKLTGGGILGCLAGLAGLGPVAYLGGAALLAGLGCAAAAMLSETKTSDVLTQFRVDFAEDPPRWTSDDEDFWREAKECLFPPAPGPDAPHP